VERITFAEFSHDFRNFAAFRGLAMAILRKILFSATAIAEKYFAREIFLRAFLFAPQNFCGF